MVGIAYIKCVEIGHKIAEFVYIYMWKSVINTIIWLLV